MKIKKYLALLCGTAIILTGCSANNSAQTNNDANKETAKYADTYTSASKTKSLVNTSDVADSLIAVSSDMATLAETKAEGYKAPENEITVQMMSVNPDGCPGFSTIHAWKYNKGENGNDTITVELTEGQNAQNLNEVGDRGTILIHTDAYYLVHVETASVEALEYTDANYEAGMFNSAYSGANDKATQYRITFNVMSIEKTFVAVFN